MKIRLRYVLLIGLLAISATVSVKSLQATAASGFTGETLVEAHGVGEIDAFTQHFLSEYTSNYTPQTNLWLSRQQTKGLSSIYVQKNTWNPNGDTGWHTHPGHSVIIVKQGTLTVYNGDCKSETYGPGQELGQAIIDVGGDHIHLIRNEGSETAITYALQIIPEGAPRRQDVKVAPACWSPQQ